MSWLRSFFQGAGSPKIAVLTRELSPLKSKIGELGAGFALDLEHGREPTDLNEQEFINTAEILIFKLKEIQETIKYEIQNTSDQKQISALNNDAAKIQKNIETLQKQLENIKKPFLPPFA